MQSAGVDSTRHPARGTQHLASAVSFLLHPFIIVPVSVLAVSDVRSSAIIALTTTLPLLALIARNVRRGTWTNYDVSVRTQRAGLYWTGIALTLVTAALLHQTGANPRFVRGVVAGAVMLMISMFINRWLKVSLHMMMAGFCGVMVGWRHPSLAIALAIALALLAWSRLALKRHTWLEVVVGSLMGCAVGAWLVLTP